MKSRIQYFLITIFAIILALIVAEISLRCIGFESPQLNEVIDSERGKFCQYDSLLGWKGKPNVQGEFVWMDCRHGVSQNNFGFRAKNYHPKTKDAREKIAVFGDSFVWGFGVENKAIFTHLLSEVCLQGFLNFGVSGYGTDQQYLSYLSLRESLEEVSTVVLVLTLNTDFWDVMDSTAYGYAKPVYQYRQTDGTLLLKNVPVPPPAEWKNAPIHLSSEKSIGILRGLHKRYSVFQVFVSALSQNPFFETFFIGKGLVASAPKASHTELDLYKEAPSLPFSMARDKLLAIVSLFNQQVKLDGKKLVLCLNPSYVQVYDKHWNAIKGANPNMNLQRTQTNGYIQKWAKANKVQLLDMLPFFMEEGKTNPNLYFPINKHWTPLGHQKAAEIFKVYFNK